MEKAVFITHCGQFKSFDAKEYSRLYFGSEFCERNIPSSQELKKAIGFARKNGMDFSLVTPYVTDRGSAQLKVLFDLLKASGNPCEVIVNDWGVLRSINASYPSFEPVIGRLLVKQKRSPGLKRLLERKTCMKFVKNPRQKGKKILFIQEKLPLEMDYYYKGSNVASVALIQDFLMSRGVRRIELDNTEQGLIMNLPKGRFFASVYVPYCYITTTFFCPTAGCDEKKRSFLRIKPCKKQCRKYVFELRHKSFSRVIYLKGNTQFYKNGTFDNVQYSRMGVDRIVYEPQIPV